MPWLHEGYHATWARSRQPDRIERWSTSLPIHCSGRILGRLDLAGPVAGRNFEAMSQLADILQDLEPQIESLLSDDALPPLSVVSTDLESSFVPSRAS